MTKREIYKREAIALLEQSTLKTKIADGEILYNFIEGRVEFRARKLGDNGFDRCRRSIKVSKFRIFATNSLIKFFAQAEADVVRNYPILNEQDLERRGYAMNLYPYYDLNYYSNGKGSIAGFIKKVQSKDDELLERLLAS